jgi:hypothetical protein
MKPTRESCLRLIERTRPFWRHVAGVLGLKLLAPTDQWLAALSLAFSALWAVVMRARPQIRGVFARTGLGIVATVAALAANAAPGHNCCVRAAEAFQLGFCKLQAQKIGEQ